MISVIKADNSKEPFSEEKVIRSIKRAKIPENIQSQVLQHIKSKIYDGISTEEIFHHIIEFLDISSEPFNRTRYSLKQAIMSLGPTGYPFEDFVAKLLETEGYATKTRQILSGKCISHEIDVVAKKNDKKIMVEAKFHNNPGIRSEVQTALYTKARFDDIKEKNNIDEAWLITNTKTTNDANTYASCVNMKVISWNYPEGEGLRDLVEKANIYPITILSSLNQASKDELFKKHIVLCKNICKNPSILNSLPLSKEDKEKVLAEVKFICNEDHV